MKRECMKRGPTLFRNEKSGYHVLCAFPKAAGVVCESKWCGMLGKMGSVGTLSCVLFQSGVVFVSVQKCGATHWPVLLRFPFAASGIGRAG